MRDYPASKQRRNTLQPPPGNRKQRRMQRPPATPDKPAGRPACNCDSLRRHVNVLLVLLATDEDISSPAAWTSFKAALANAIADVDHAMDDTHAHDDHECPLCGAQRCRECDGGLYPWEAQDDNRHVRCTGEAGGNQPEGPTSLDLNSETTNETPATVEPPERCTGCGLQLYPWEHQRGTCTACHQHQDAA